MKNNHGKAIKWLMVTVLLSALILSAGCIGQDTGATNGQNANTAQVTAAPTQTPAAEKVPIAPEILGEYLPPSSNTWIAGELKSGTEKDGLTAMTWASRTYDNSMSDATITISIQDTLGEEIGNAEGWNYLYDFTYPNYEMHSKIVQDYPSWIIYDREADMITLLTMIDNRIVVSFEVANGYDTYITMFEKLMSFKKIAELIK